MATVPSVLVMDAPAAPTMAVALLARVEMRLSHVRAGTDGGGAADQLDLSLSVAVPGQGDRAGGGADSSVGGDHGALRAARTEGVDGAADVDGDGDGLHAGAAAHDGDGAAVDVHDGAGPEGDGGAGRNGGGLALRDGGGGVGIGGLHRGGCGRLLFRGLSVGGVAAVLGARGLGVAVGVAVAIRRSVVLDPRLGVIFVVFFVALVVVRLFGYPAVPNHRHQRLLECPSP